MERHLATLSPQRFDLAVLGGGILGACVAWDAALRGLSVALLERDDFASGTSSNSLKIVHGGLRHLQHLGVAGMRISVRERSTWLRIAPHLVQPLPVVVPLYGSAAQRLAFRLALAVNDALSFDRNFKLAPDQRLPDGRALSRREVLERVPQLESTPVSGGVLFYDALMYAPERLVLTVVQAASAAGAVVANHTECVGPSIEAGQREGVRVLDRIGGGEFTVRAKVIVNATGPAAGALTGRLADASPRPAKWSLAWNLVLPALGPEVAFALPGATSTPTGSRGGGPRRLFLVPWRGRTLIGTGHAPFFGDPASFSGIGRDHRVLAEFLDELNRSWPGPAIGAHDALLIHAGLLPAQDAVRPGEVRLQRSPSVSETRAGGAPILTAATVKFTTSRQLAQDVVDRVCEIVGHRAASVSAHTLLPGAPEQGMPRLLQTARDELAADLDVDVIEHLVHTHGAAYRDVVRWRAEDPRWSQRVSPGSPVIRAQLLHGARHEMACGVDDLLRRTELGARGPVDDAAREQVAQSWAQTNAAARGTLP